MRRKVLLVVMLIIAILLQCVMPLTVASASSSVEITLNKNLYKAVKAQLESKDIKASYVDSNYKIVISQDELAKITSLNLSNAEIDDLTGLSIFANVTELNLTANELTEDSNLAELNSLNLNKLNLSSNKIGSVSAITNFDSIKNSDITNQELTQKEIISVDVSEESNQETTATITLPDILLKDGNILDSECIYSEIIDGTADVDWKLVSPGSTDLVLTVASGKGDSYKVKNGLVKIIVDYSKKSTSKIANTKMTFYYAIVDSTETGIIFEDENLYTAVKTQLTAGQTENEELASYGTTGETLYKRNYDEPFILVIDANTVINEIPSLILNDKRITDLTGIEEFVGLNTNLNVSFNYIDTIEKILELEENKEIKEKALQEKYTNVLNKLTEIRNTIDSIKKEIESKNDEISQKTKDIAAATDDSAKEKLQKELANLKSELGNLQYSLTNNYKIESQALQKLYKIYEKEYKLTSLLPYEINVLSSEVLNKADLETIKSYVTSIIDRVSSLEKSESLTSYEQDAISKIWGITLTETVEGEEIKIENPISKYFETELSIIESSVESQWTQYYNILNTFKYLDVIDQAYNYCLIEKMNTDTSDCQVDNALEEIKDYLEKKDFDTTWVDTVIAIKADSSSAELPSSVLKSLIKSMECEGSYTTDNDTEYQLAGKLISSASDIENYVTLPRIQTLNVKDNQISDIAGLESLSELRELNAYKNVLGSIKDIDWSTFTHLKTLNLGYNQLSDVKCLEEITTLESLNLSRNLLSGNFDFYLVGLKNLKEADFSYNQYTNIAYLLSQYTFIAKSYTMNVGDYLTSELAPKLNFQYQILSTDLTVVKTGDTITVDLPKIFSQFEQIDYSRTSFGETSHNGTVLADGTAVVLRTPAVGTYHGKVVVDGYNGNTYTTDGIGFGTYCEINYTVIEETVTEPEDPDDSTETPEEPSENPDNNNEVVTPAYGYNVENGYVYIVNPETSLSDFASRLVSLEDYNVTICDNKSATNIATGSVVSIDKKSDGSNVALLEVVVKGDVNGDGEIDALDSGLIRATINDTYAPIGVYESAADVNCDGEVDTLDALLVLQYRADKISSFED
jgi:hypothetical protein